MSRTLLATLFFALPISLVYAAEHEQSHENHQGHEMEMGHYLLKPVSDEIQRLATLAGTWEGFKEEAEGEDMPVTVEYYLSSGGSALVERLFKESPMEMTSIYHDNGEELMMTHYCGLGNQPRYSSRGFEGDSITFDFHDATNMASPTEQHMHGVKLTLISDDELLHEWQHYNDGKLTETVVVRLKRVE